MAKASPPPFPTPTLAGRSRIAPATDAAAPGRLPRHGRRSSGAGAAGAGPVELGADSRFAGRIRRLARTALVALGLIWALAVLTLGAPAPVAAALLAGWISMPLLLWLSLDRPRLRYALVVPSGLVGGALLALRPTAAPTVALARFGWLLLTAGIWLGGGLGVWFWFRPRWLPLPVPAALDDPFSAGRWLLVGLHVGLVVVGMALAAVG